MRWSARSPTLRPLTQGRLVVVFGCGGDRDRGKRPLMGRIAAELADLAVVTSDNPRTEDPEAIIDDIEQGMGAVAHLRIADRLAAIHTALEQARRGRHAAARRQGSRDYQILGTEKVPFDEREIVRQAVARQRRMSEQGIRAASRFRRGGSQPYGRR